MSDISLRTYIEEIDGLIDRKQLDEAVAHCRHILSLYPKHLDAYRMLGKALLDKGRHGDAADIFQRVLSVVPDDFIAQLGMAIIREDEANLDSALWHMERAFEVSPANAAIQEELRRLYARRDGVTPPKARLTRGALARMYALGDLHHQAEAELHSALVESPDRVDLETVLAQVYFYSGQLSHAAKTCTAILQKLPYSRDANRILSDILRTEGRAAEATPYRQRLEAIDPYEAFADPNANGQGAAAVKPETIRLSRLDYLPGMDDSGSPDWVASAGLRFEEGDHAAEPAPASDWLGAAAAPFAADAPATAELPDWLREMQPASAAAPTPESAPETAPGDTDWLSALRGEAPAEPAAELTPTEEMPDWLKSATHPLTPETMPDWMRQPAAEAPLPAAEADWLTPKAEPAADVSDWMAAASAGTAGAVAASASAAPEIPAAAPAEDVPDWMKAVAPPAPADEVPEWMKPAASIAEPLPAADVPDWMRAADAAEPTPAVNVPDWMRAAETPAAPSEEKPDWLKQMEAESDAYEASIAGATPAAKPKISADELPDFLQPASTEALERANRPSEFADIAAELPVLEEAPAAQPAELPEWLKAMAPAEPAAPAPAPAMSEDDALKWLETLALQQGAKPEEMVSAQPAAEPPPVVEAALPTPEWLRPAEVSAEAEAQPAEELPEWAKPPAASSPMDTISSWLATKPVPDWMRQPGAETQAPPPEWLRPAEPATAPAEPTSEFPDWIKAAEPLTPSQATPAAAQPDLDAMSPDEALRWLEGLAAQQGAPAEELITQPPAAQAAPLVPPIPSAAPSAQPDLDAMSPDEALRWLEGLAAQQGAPAEELITRPEERFPVAPPISAAPPVSKFAPTTPLSAPAAEPDLSTMSADEAMRWLEGLAAQQGAPAEELITRPEERPAETPAWIAAEVAEAPAAPAIAEADLSAMSADEAMRWLEGLAAQQGAPAEELITRPEERPAVTPAWIAAEVEAAAEPAAAEPAAEAPAAEPDVSTMEADEAMRWLESLAAQQGASADELITPPAERLTEPPQWIASQKTEPLAEAPAAAPDLSTMEADDAMRWLESLAAHQGASADELITPPAERLTEPPQWIASQKTEPLAEAPAAPETMQTAPLVEPPPVTEPPSAPKTVSETPSAEGDVFRWLESLEAQPAAPVASPPPDVKPPEQPRPESATKLSRLAEQLSARKRSKEDDIAKRFETQRAEKEAAMREVAEKMEQKKRPGTGSFPARPGTGPLGARPGTGPLGTRPGTGPLGVRPGTGPLPPLAEEPRPAAVTPKKKAAPPKPIARPKKGKLSKSPYAAFEPGEVLNQAHRSIRDGNDDAAAEALSYLIARGQGLQEVTVELESATRARPDAAGLWQVLGDAYMRDNHLQKALDAYRQALGQM